MATVFNIHSIGKLEQCETPVGSGSANYGCYYVGLSCATSGAAIHYTTDGSTPTNSSPVYTSSLYVSSYFTLKAIAVKAGYENSEVFTQTYSVSSPPKPTGSVTQGYPTTFTASCFLSGATIQYKCGGGSWTNYSGQTQTPKSAGGSVYVRSYYSGLYSNEVYIGACLWKVPTPSISPYGGTFSGSKLVYLTCAAGSATIYYTTNGSSPSTSSSSGGMVTITSSCTLRVRAYENNCANSNLVSASFTIT